MINYFLSLIKWPLACFMVIIILPTIIALKELIFHYMNEYLAVWFVLPMIVMAGIWLFVPSLSGSFLAILEHEVTHMIFALLTGHKPVNLEVHQNKGGYFSFKGKGNWLIALSPYFFPTFAFFVMMAGLIYKIMAQPLPDIYWSVLGVMTGYHVASTLLEIHPKQTDFKIAGYLFTILFLPGINLIMYGLLLSYACLGWSGMPFFIQAVGENTAYFVQHLFYE